MDDLVGHGADATEMGFARTAEGAFVDVDELLESHLSTSERATVALARGIAVMESHGGGFPHHLPCADPSALPSTTSPSDPGLKDTPVDVIDGGDRLRTVRALRTQQLG